MITREQYLEALDIVETYHQQLRQSIVGNNLTLIDEWDRLDICSTRLRNVLLRIKEGAMCYNEKQPSYKEVFIEKIRIEEMCKISTCGRTTINEFISLRGY